MGAVKKYIEMKPLDEFILDSSIAKIKSDLSTAFRVAVYGRLNRMLEMNRHQFRPEKSAVEATQVELRALARVKYPKLKPFIERRANEAAKFWATEQAITEGKLTESEPGTIKVDLSFIGIG